MTYSNVKTLVKMQLQDKMDLSFVKNKRSLILKTGLTILKPIIVTVVFFLLFLLSVKLSVFSFSSLLPDTVVNVIFTVMQIMAIVTCSVGLSGALFTSADNKVLLTLPVSSTEIFFSKLILFYVFELKRNVSFLLPMFLAYGIVNGAVWYFYPWLLLCFLLISALPVAIGAVLSIPTMYFVNFVRRHKVLQFVLMAAVSSACIVIIVSLINLIPENINILGQWGSISANIQKFLKAFANALIPFYWVCLMAIGGTLRISTHLFAWDTLWYFLGVVGTTALFLLGAYMLARPLFFKMASRQFEYEKMIVPAKKNKLHSQRISPYFESWKMYLRSSRKISLTFVELALPAVLILFLNKLYAAMNTSFSGLKLTQLFNIIVMFVTVLSFNTPYASVYSREANSRNILKTRPTNVVRTLFARISLRAVVTVISCVAMLITYQSVSGEDKLNAVFLCVTVTATAVAHLLWCAETDVMHSQADQYQTIGADYNNPNERNATIIGILLAGVFTLMYYVLSNGGLLVYAFMKLAIVAVVFLIARVFLFVKRAKLYFVEN